MPNNSNPDRSRRQLASVGVEVPSYGPSADFSQRTMPKSPRPQQADSTDQDAPQQGVRQPGWRTHNSMGFRALRENRERKQNVQAKRHAAYQQRADSYEAKHGRPLHFGGTPRPTQFAPDAQQRQLVSQGVDRAVPRPPRPEQQPAAAAAPVAAPAAVPPTDGGEGHAAADQLPNAPERAPAFNDGSGATYTTGTGRTGSLPAGVAVDYREDGTPVFSDAPGTAAAAAAAQPGQAQQPAQAQPTDGAARMLASALQAQQQGQGQGQQPAAPRRASRRTTEPVTGEASRMASMRRNDLAWDMRRMGRGSPSTRRGLMDAYQQEQRLGADAVQGQANRDNQFDIAQMGHQAQAAEGAANRQLTASGQMLTAAQQAEQARQFNMGSRTLTGADGTVHVFRNDGSVAPLQGADGEPFRAAPTSAEGQVTPAIQYQALSRQLQSIQETAAMNPASGLEEQMQQIQAQMNALAGGGQVQHAAPSEPPAEAIAELRSDPSAAAEFDQVFGPGAAARYLGN